MSTNLEIIKSIAAGESRHLSTSQACMCGLALCRPDLIEKEHLTVAQAWGLIDDEQLYTILVFTEAWGLIGG